MALVMGKRDAQRMLTVLDPEYPNWQAEAKALKKSGDDADRLELLVQQMAGAEEFAKEALAIAVEVIHDKAKFTVVGQIKKLDPETDRCIGEKVALGWYATEKQAVDDALKLAYSTQTHEEAMVHVVPLWTGTPSNWYVGRKEVQKLAELAEQGYRQHELQRRITWRAEHPNEPTPDEWSVLVAFDNETEECVVCEGMGRLPAEDMKRARQARIEREAQHERIDRRLAAMAIPHTTECFMCDGLGRLADEREDTPA